MFNTYAQMLELVRLGYAKVSTNGHLDTFKYAKKVMFKYLWDEIPGIFECRGHTYDNRTGQLVVAAPTKSFNYLEKDTWKDVPLDTLVYAYKKYNGFLACSSMHGDELVISTTGSTKSDFVKMAESLIVGQGVSQVLDDCTNYYEIIHSDDPHIVDEGPARAVLLGWRYLDNGFFFPVSEGDLTIQTPVAMTLGEAIEMAKTDRGEGFMLHRVDEFYSSDKTICKLKTPYYVGKKKLMRANQAQVKAMFNSPVEYEYTLPELWKNIPWLITKIHSEEVWTGMDDQARRASIESFEEMGYLND